MGIDLKSWLDWLQLVSGIFFLLAGLFAAFWAYARFILEKGLLPASEFDVSCNIIGPWGEKRILEILLVLKNVGSSTLVVTNLRADIRYVEDSGDGVESAGIFDEVSEAKFGSFKFPKSLLRDDLKFKGQIFVGKKSQILDFGKRKIRVGEEGVVVLGTTGEILVGNEVKSAKLRSTAGRERGGRGIPVLRHDTFVQPGVRQVYPLVTAVPSSARYVLIHSSFGYGLNPSRIQRILLAMARWLGLVQFNLTHVRESHTAQRVFDVAASGAPTSS